jgi:hypothetical protein
MGYAVSAPAETKTLIRADKPFPSFFLVGAPRCGTTAMSRALEANPQICFSVPKETHYFSKTHLESPACVQTEYVDRFFFHRLPSHRAMGEGSVSYLYSEAAIDQILQLNPDARFLVMVRNPLEMVPSFHRLMLFFLEEDVEDFAEAWALQERRLRGERLPRTNTDRLVLQYREIGSLGKYIDRLQQQSSKEQVQVLVYDDFRRDPIPVYRQALRFLGVDDDGRTEMPVRMTTRYYRSQRLHRLLYKPPVRFGGLPAMVKLRARDARRGHKSALRRLHKRLVRWNTVNRPPQPLDPGMRRVLIESFAGDVAHLGQLLGRDLSRWLA